MTRTPVTSTNVAVGDIVVRQASHDESVDGYFALCVTAVMANGALLPPVTRGGPNIRTEPLIVVSETNDPLGRASEWPIDGSLYLATDADRAAYHARQQIRASWEAAAEARADKTARILREGQRAADRHL